MAVADPPDANDTPQGYVEFYPAYGSTLGKDVFVYLVADSPDKIAPEITASACFKSILDMLRSRYPNGLDYSAMDDIGWFRCQFKNSSRLILNNRGWHDFQGFCRDRKPFVSVARPSGKARFAVEVLAAQAKPVYVEIDVRAGMVTPVQLNFAEIDSDQGTMSVVLEEAFPIADLPLWTAQRRSEKRPKRPAGQTPASAGGTTITASYEIGGATVTVSTGSIEQAFQAKAILEKAAEGLDLTQGPGRAEFDRRWQREKKARPELGGLAVTIAADPGAPPPPVQEAPAELEARKKASQEFLKKEIAESDRVLFREREIAKMTDQILLTKIAAEDPEERFRAAAVSQITDQALLTRYARDASDRVRMAACRNLDDQALLVKIACEEKLPWVCEAAVKRIADPAVLAKIAFAEGMWGTSRAAVMALSDQEQLVRVAREHRLAEFRGLAAAKLTDRSVLDKIAQEDESAEVRRAARERSQSIPIMEKADQANWDAYERSQDMAALAKLATISIFWDTRLKAIAKLSDRVLLDELFRQADNEAIRQAAKKRLGELSAAAK
jgi:antirestriction protein